MEKTIDMENLLELLLRNFPLRCAALGNGLRDWLPQTKTCRKKQQLSPCRPRNPRLPKAVQNLLPSDGHMEHKTRLPESNERANRNNKGGVPGGHKYRYSDQTWNSQWLFILAESFGRQARQAPARPCPAAPDGDSHLVCGERPGATWCLELVLFRHSLPRGPQCFLASPVIGHGGPMKFSKILASICVFPSMDPRSTRDQKSNVQD